MSSHVVSIAGRSYELDAGSGRIQFLDSRFYRCADGSFVPSVTTILEAYPKGAQYYEWLKRRGQDADEIRDEAGRRGSVVHDATERLDLGDELNLMGEDESPRYRLAEWAMIQRYVEFREQHPAMLHAVEMRLADARRGYAGTLDRLMTFDATGQVWLVDIKTGGGIWPSYWLQQAAYHDLLHTTGALARIFPDGVPEVRMGVLWLNAQTRTIGKKGATQGVGWQLIEQPEPTNVLIDRFRMVHGIWLAEHAGELPRTTSYRLNLKITREVSGAQQDTDQTP